MAIPQRNVTITGVFAENAATTIPAVPVAGTSYRDTEMTAEDINTGWPYKTIVDSSQFNQAMYQYSAISKMQEVYGFVPWSNLTDYVEGSYCLGSDGVLYQAQQNTGPSSTAFDPTNDYQHTYWDDVISKMLRIATPAGSILAFAGTSAPTGFLMCDGSAVSRNTYSTLFSVIGTSYGSGDGSTTFNLPDYRDRTLFMRNDKSVGQTSLGSIPDHRHSATYNGAYAGPYGWGSGGDAIASTYSLTTSWASQDTSLFGSSLYSQSVNKVIPSHASCNFIIKY